MLSETLAKQKERKKTTKKPIFGCSTSSLKKYCLYLKFILDLLPFASNKLNISVGALHCG